MVDFFNFFKSKKPEELGELSPNPIEMATAVLLIEMARADFDQAKNENEVIRQLLKAISILTMNKPMIFFVRR